MDMLRKKLNKKPKKRKLKKKTKRKLKKKNTNVLDDPTSAPTGTETSTEVANMPKMTFETKGLKIFEEKDKALRIHLKEVFGDNLFHFREISGRTDLQIIKEMYLDKGVEPKKSDLFLKENDLWRLFPSLLTGFDMSSLFTRMVRPSISIPLKRSLSPLSCVLSTLKNEQFFCMVKSTINLRSMPETSDK